MIFRRLERPLTQMKTEGFTIKLKDLKIRMNFNVEYIPGIEPSPTDYESVVRPTTLKYLRMNDSYKFIFILEYIIRVEKGDIYISSYLQRFKLFSIFF